MKELQGDIEILYQDWNHIVRQHERLKEDIDEYLEDAEDDLYTIMERHNMDIDLDSIYGAFSEADHGMKEIRRVLLREMV